MTLWNLLTQFPAFQLASNLQGSLQFKFNLPANLMYNILTFLGLSDYGRVRCKILNLFLQLTCFSLEPDVILLYYAKCSMSVIPFQHKSCSACMCSLSV